MVTLSSRTPGRLAPLVSPSIGSVAGDPQGSLQCPEEAKTLSFSGYSQHRPHSTACSLDCQTWLLSPGDQYGRSSDQPQSTRHRKWDTIITPGFTSERAPHLRQVRTQEEAPGIEDGPDSSVNQVVGGGSLPGRER